MKPLWKEQSWKVSDVQIVRETWVLVAKDKSNRPVADSLRSVPQESRSRTTLPGKGNDWRNREHVVLDILKLKMFKIEGILWWTSGVR